MSTSVPQTEQVLDRRTRRGRTEGPSQKLKNFGGMVRPCWRQPSYPREVDCKPNVKRSSTRRCDVNAFSTEGFVASLTTYCSRDVLPSSNAHHDRSFTRPIVFLNTVNPLERSSQALRPSQTVQSEHRPSRASPHHRRCSGRRLRPSLGFVRRVGTSWTQEVALLSVARLVRTAHECSVGGVRLYVLVVEHRSRTVVAM